MRDDCGQTMVDRAPVERSTIAKICASGLGHCDGRPRVSIDVEAESQIFSHQSENAHFRANQVSLFHNSALGDFCHY